MAIVSGTGAGAGLGLVTSVFTRTGAVTAQTGDYTAAQVTNAADKASALAQAFTAPINAAGNQFAVNAGGDLTARNGNPPSIQLNAGGPGSTAAITFATDTQMWRKSAGIMGFTGIAANPVSSGSLPTVSPSSGVAFQTLTTRDTFLNVPVTFTPTAGASATCKVELSPDNVTYSTLVTETVPAGTALDSFIHGIRLQVPAGWWVKLTVTNATLGTGTYY